MMMSRVFALKLPERYALKIIQWYETTRSLFFTRLDAPVNTSITSEPESIPTNPFNTHSTLQISRSCMSLMIDENYLLTFSSL